uniref:AH domain-containing protein n=1 Tax=Monopterus albus TaxID=43700 RepID=A0A3Q3JYJ3_MONAL
MKSGGFNLPKSQSAASRLAQHTDRHPGITRQAHHHVHTVLTPFIVTTHTISVNLCLVIFSRLTCIILHIILFSFPGSSNLNTSSSTEVSRGVAVEKLDSVKKWGINTYKCTKQMFSERFGRGSRTVDLELEAQIDMLRETKNKYENILRLATALINHFQSMVQTQQALGDTFTDLSQKSPELQDEFGYNAETQKLLCKNGEALLGAINFFVSSVNTLVNKTMEDTLMTIKQYENARLEFDAYRSDLEELSLGPRDAAAMVRIEMAQHEYQIHRDKYERLRSDVTIKLKFLEENKVCSLQVFKILWHLSTHGMLISSHLIFNLGYL